VSDKDLEANININLDKSLDTAIDKLDKIDKAWNKLASAPAIDLEKKIVIGARVKPITTYFKQKKPGQRSSPSGMTLAEWKRETADFEDSYEGVDETARPNIKPKPNVYSLYGKEEETQRAMGLDAYRRKKIIHAAPITICEPIKAGIFGPKPVKTEEAGIGLKTEEAGIGLKTEQHREEVKALEEGKTEVKKLSYSYDNLFKDELALVTDKEKKDKFLNIMEEKAFKTFRTAPASETGKYHPVMMNEQGGLLLHSKAVAQASLAIAADKGYTGNKDDLVLQALGHDMAKLNAYGKSDLYGHAKKAGEYFDEVGLPSSAIRSHMYTGKGNGLMGTLKPVTEEEKILKEADLLVSRTYAQDYIKAEDGRITGIDLAGLRKAALDKGDLIAVGGGGGDGEPPKEYVAASEASNERAKKDKESEKSWHSILSSASKFAKVLTGLGLAVGYAAIKATDTGSGLAQSGMSAFTGMTSKEILDNELREKKVKAGAGSINAEIQALAEKRATFQRTGKADIFDIAVFGEVGNLLLSKDPMQDVYAAMMDELAARVAAEKDQTKREGMMGQISERLGPTSAKMINFMILQKQTYAQTGERYKPGNDAWLSNSIGIDAEMQTYLNSIKNSFSQILTAFQDFAGNPILKFFADVVSDLAHSATTGKPASGMRLLDAAGSATVEYENSARGKQLRKAADYLGFKAKERGKLNEEFLKQAKEAGLEVGGDQGLLDVRNAANEQYRKELEAKVQEAVRKEQELIDSETGGAKGIPGKKILMNTGNVNNYYSLAFPNATRASEISEGIQRAASNMSTNNAMNNLYIGAVG